VTALTAARDPIRISDHQFAEQEGVTDAYVCRFLPLTCLALEGVAVSGWAAIKDEVLQLASAVPFVPYVGWDVVLADDGMWILEANNRTDLKLPTPEVCCPETPPPRWRRRQSKPPRPSS
jgi:Sugar-transfer associated ATP-grasp